MSKKQKTQATKNKSLSKVSDVISHLPGWLKFVGLIVPILGLIISYFSYSLEKQNYSDDLKVLVSTELKFNGRTEHFSPPDSSPSFILRYEIVCGRYLIISNIGGVSTAIIGFKGNFYIKVFPSQLFLKLSEMIFSCQKLLMLFRKAYHLFK